MLLSSIHENTLSVYYTELSKLNYDETLDTVPTSSADPVPLENLYPKKDVPMNEAPKFEPQPKVQPDINFNSKAD
jgi:hypothetical protein